MEDNNCIVISSEEESIILISSDSTESSVDCSIWIDTDSEERSGNTSEYAYSQDDMFENVSGAGDDDDFGEEQWERDNREIERLASERGERILRYVNGMISEKEGNIF